jgi:riboflavin synthase
MFTGIIESTGRITDIKESGSGRIFRIASPISNELKPDQSLSHDGACLTVEFTQDGIHQVTAIRETLKKTTLGEWKTGDLVNLERCLPMNGRLDGHIVQGHVDSTAQCTERRETGGSWEFRFEIPAQSGHLIIEKGSISLNGISLTIFDVKKKTFRVAVIPYTFDHTNIRTVYPGMMVNVEFDMIGKYIARIQQLSSKK